MTATLFIEHAVTADMNDGQPLPPFIENGVIWYAIQRSNNKTTWRRISLKNEIALLPAVRRTDPGGGS
jgi:hypothetical protein